MLIALLFSSKRTFCQNSTVHLVHFVSVEVGGTQIVQGKVSKRVGSGYDGVVRF